MKTLTVAPVEMVGIEELGLTYGSGGPVWGVVCYGGYACWLKNIKTSICPNYHLMFLMSCRMQIKGVYVNDSNGHTENHSGIIFGSSSTYNGCCGSLVEDCIIIKNFPGIEVNYGSSGNVFAYNYVYDSYQDGFGEGASIDADHGPHCVMNLYEGNITSMFQCDGYFGSSYYGTVYRSYSSGIGWTYTDPNKAIALNRWALYWNVAGCVLGTNASSIYEMTTSGDTTATIYQLGYPNMGNNSYTGNRPPNAPVNPGDDQSRDLFVITNIYRHGNWDKVSNAILWASTNADHVLPNSYYLTSKPSWFGNLTWPPIDPSTPTYSRSITNIPAGYRFTFGTNPPADTPTTFYIATNGSTSNDGLSPATPWPQSKVETNGGGITYYFASGDYTNLTLNVTNTTIIATTKWGPRIIGLTNAHGINVAASNCVVDGFIITNSFIDGLKMNASSNRIRNCWVVKSGQGDPSGTNLAMGISGHGYNSNIVEMNLVEYNGVMTNSDHGIYVDGTNITIRGNVVRYNKTYGIKLADDVRNTHDSYIYENIVYGNPKGITVETHDGTSSTNYVLNNTILAAEKDAVTTFSGVLSMTNNILLAQPSYYTYVTNAPTTLREDYDLVSKEGVTAYGTHTVTNANLTTGFVSTNIGLYWLNAGATARGMAVPITLAVDFFGNASPTITDVGAVQYTSALAADTRTLDPSGSTGGDYWGTPVPGGTFIQSVPGLRARRGR